MSWKKKNTLCLISMQSWFMELGKKEVRQIRLQATVTSSVVTYVVIIDAPNPDEIVEKTELVKLVGADVPLETEPLK